MNRDLTFRRGRTTAALCLSVTTGLAFALAMGCNQSHAAPERSRTDERAPVAGGAKAETDTYVVELKAAGPYKAGQEGTVEATLVTKGDYHINKQYPYKFKAPDPAPDGITYPKPILQRADGTFDEKTGSFKVPFVAAKAGKAHVEGTFSFSVCSDANCIMEKQALALDVDIK